jgi:hypothetical protein
MRISFEEEIVVRHPTYGVGVITGTSRDMDGVDLMFIRWHSTEKHGVAGGWYDIMSDLFTVEDAVALVSAMRA